MSAGGAVEVAAGERLAPDARLLRALERAFAVLVLAAALGWWASQAAAPRPAVRDDAPTALERLAADGGRRARLAQGAVGAALLTGVVALAGGLAWARRPDAAGRTGVARLRAAWTAGAAASAPGPAGPTVGHFLVAFGVFFLAQVPLATSAPGGLLAPVGPGAPGGGAAPPERAPAGAGASSAGAVEVGPRGVFLAGDGPVAPAQAPGAAWARVAPGLGIGRLDLLPGAPAGGVRVDGHPVAPGAPVGLPDQAHLEVGAWAARWTGPPLARQLGWSTAGAACGILALVALLLLAGGPEGLAAAGVTLGADAGRGPGADLGSARRAAREGLRGALGLAVAVAPLALVMVGWAALGAALGMPTGEHPLVRALERDGPGALGLVVLQAVVLAPLGEELLFRGLLLAALRRVASPGLAVVGSAVAFASVHHGFGSFGPMVLLGLLFGALAVTAPRGGLLAAVVAHALHNAGVLTLVALSL